MLQLEPDPAVYVYHQQYTFDNSTVTRKALICLTRIPAKSSQDIRPIFSRRALADDGEILRRTCRANVRPAIALYSDPQLEIQSLLSDVVQNQLPVSATDRHATTHSIWPITDLTIVDQLSSRMATKRLYLARGINEYESASVSDDDNWRQLLTVCGAWEDPGLRIRPKHQLFSGVDRWSADQIAARLKDCFEVTEFGHGIRLAHSVWEQIEIEADQSTVGLCSGAEQTWMTAKLNDRGRRRLAELHPTRSDAWRSLGSTILHRLIVDDLLDGGETISMNSDHQIQNIIQFVEDGEQRDSNQMPFVGLVATPSFKMMQNVCDQNDHLSPRFESSFIPSPLSGLVLHALDA